MPRQLQGEPPCVAAASFQEELHHGDRQAKATARARPARGPPVPSVAPAASPAWSTATTSPRSRSRSITPSSSSASMRAGSSPASTSSTSTAPSTEIPRDFQLDPVKDLPVHVDFMRLGVGAKIRVRIPVHVMNADQAPGEARRHGQHRHPRGRGRVLARGHPGIDRRRHFGSRDQLFEAPERRHLAGQVRVVGKVDPTLVTIVPPSGYAEEMKGRRSRCCRRRRCCRCRRGRRAGRGRSRAAPRRPGRGARRRRPAPAPPPRLRHRRRSKGRSS